MNGTSSTDARGRTVVQLHDDSGIPFSFVSSAISVLGQSEQIEIISIPLTPDENAQPRPRPALTRGQVLLSAQVVFDDIALDYALIDVEVVGYVGSQETTIARVQLGGNQPLARVTFQEDDTFHKIGVRARMMANGLPTSSTASISAAQLSALAYMWS